MDNKKISPNRQKKEKIVAELLDKVTRAKGMVFTNYQGMTHKQLEGLKKKVQALNADFVSTKNTLIKIALEKISKISNAPDDTFKGSTGTLFLYGDPASPLKELAKNIKEFNLPTIKFGILDGLTLTTDDVMKISSLPSREVLLTQLAIGLKSPISGLHRALNWNMQKFVLTLNAIKQQKTN